MSYGVVDALEVYAQYSQLSTSLTEAQIAKLLKSASPTGNYAIDGLRTLLIGRSVVDGAPSTFDGLGERESLRSG